MRPEDRYDPAALVDTVVDGLRAESDSLEQAQAVRGLDAYTELALHPVVARGFSSAGFGVHREQRYPQDRSHKRRNHGQRCDLVLTPPGSALPSDATAAQTELFPAPPATAFEDACWIEMKTVAQFVECRPNRAWALALARPVFSDVEKLARDPSVRHALLLMVLFSQSQTVAEHDLEQWAHRALDRGLEFRLPHIRHLGLVDRWGNNVCTAALFPLAARQA